MTALSRLRDERGQSLIEILVVLGLLLLVAASALVILENVFQTERGQGARREVIEDQRFAMDRMTKDIRQALSVDTTSTTSRLEIRTLVQGAETDVVFDVVSGELRRAEGTGNPVPLISGLTSSDVFCYDPPDCVLANPDTASPALIRVSLEVKPDTRGAQTVAVATDVHLRNT